MSELKLYAIPNGATHFMQSTDEDRDHFVISDEVGNVSATFCPDHAFLGWDSDIEIEPISVNAIPLPYYKSIIDKDQQIKKLTEALESVTTRKHIDFVRCGMGANYSGEFYEKQLDEMWSPYVEAQKLLAEIKG